MGPMPVFLDVDGVLSPLPPVRLHPDLRPLTGGRGFIADMLHNPHLTRALADLHARDVIAITWLTTWEHEANRDLAPLLRWPPLPTITRPQTLASARGWKADAIETHAPKSGPYVWVDDDISPTVRDHYRRLHGARALLLAPDRGTGITRAHLTALTSHLTQQG